MPSNKGLNAPEQHDNVSPNLEDLSIENLKQKFGLLTDDETKDLIKHLNKRKPHYSWWIKTILFVFAFVSLGTTIIIGIRLWFNSPIHPSFALYGTVTFSAAIAFAIILTFDVVTGGDLTFEFAGQKFNGTSGPVTLWILAFSAIMAAFIFGGFANLSQSTIPPQPSLDQCFQIDCTKIPLQNKPN